MRPALALLPFALLVAACGENHPPAGDDAGIPDAAPDAPVSTTVSPCLDRPDRLDTTPQHQLPCELISPGFQP